MHDFILSVGVLIAYFVFSAAVGAMSEPRPDQQATFYGWLYRFLQRLAANADRMAQARYPQLFNEPHDLGGAQLVASHTETDVLAASTGGK